MRADEKQNKFQSLDMKNIPKNINALKKGVSEALGINFMAVGEDWRLRKIGNSFNFELFKIENDRDVWNLKNEDKVEIVYEPRRDNIVKKAVVEDAKPKSSWDKFTGGKQIRLTINIIVINSRINTGKIIKLGSMNIYLPMLYIKDT